jgi:hypothetical protein
VCIVADLPVHFISLAKCMIVVYFISMKNVVKWKILKKKGIISARSREPHSTLKSSFASFVTIESLTQSNLFDNANVQCWSTQEKWACISIEDRHGQSTSNPKEDSSTKNALATQKINTINGMQTPISSSTQTHMNPWASAMGDSLQFQHRNPLTVSIEDSPTHSECALVHKHEDLQINTVFSEIPNI